MRLLVLVSWTLYIFKCFFISSWLAHSIYLLTYPVNVNVIWNLISSLYLLILDILGHILYLIRKPPSSSSKASTLKVFFAIFWLQAGPGLLLLTVYGSLTDSINYEVVFCRRGCLISILLRDFHYVVLFILSIISSLGFCVYSHSLLFKNEAVTSLCMNGETPKHTGRRSTQIEPLLIEGIPKSISEKSLSSMYRSVST